ncbi:MAG: N-acetylmuramoyl-L-alanine amidase [Phycisphaerales bacterium]|nr:N-acetylmuramoyl-L-alanine amidase [Phycisphaerales bacterium]
MSGAEASQNSDRRLPSRMFAQVDSAAALGESQRQMLEAILPRHAFTLMMPMGADAGGLRPLHQPFRITIHHDGLPTPWTNPNERATAVYLERIRQFHVQPPPEGRGWADIGYHFAVDVAGRVWQLRSLEWQGAHVKGANEGNIGIVALGNFDLTAPSAQQLSSLELFTDLLCCGYHIGWNNVYMHGELAANATSCPGTYLADCLRQLRARRLADTANA